MAADGLARLKAEYVESHRISLGAIGIAMAIVVTLLQVSTLSDYLTTALALFSVAVPVLTFMVLASEAGLQIEAGWPTLTMNFLYFGSLALVWAGLVFTVAHLNAVCGFAFFGASLLCLALLRLCYRPAQ